MRRGVVVIKSLSSLFSPSSIAVIGASRTPGKVGHDILVNIKKGGFAGPIVPVNLKAKRILGLRAYPSLSAYGNPVDLCIVAVPRSSVTAAVEDALEVGVGAFIVISAGFKETDQEGRKIEENLVDICSARNVRVLGPNCLGLINTGHAMNASFAGPMPQAGAISVISQSGAICTALLDLAAARGIGFSKVVSMGNKADISEVDLLAYLADDPETRVIVGYLEDIVSGDAFISAAEAASTKKPVVMLKAGTTEAGKKAATSHTGVLAGAEVAYGAAFIRSGIVRADHFEDILDYAMAFSTQPVPVGRRVLIVTNAGGPGAMAADAVENAGLTVARLEGGTVASLRERLPRAASTANPVDVLGDADPQRYAAALETAQKDPSVDAIVVILTPQAMTKPRETALAIAGSITREKPVLAAFMGGKDVLPARKELLKAGLPDYGAPERAVSSLAAMCGYGQWRRRPLRVVTRFPVNRRRVERILGRHLRSGRFQVGDAKAKEILEAYGFAIPKGVLCQSRAEAVEAAEVIGFPVVMKVVSGDIVHKSDLGAVRLGIATRQEARDAYDLMMLRMRELAPNALIDGIHVEQMIPRGLEVIIGMSRDPYFGPMLMFGLGGIFVEVMKDVTFYLAPITHAEAVQMLRNTRSYAVLSGARGRPPVDLDALATCLQRISQLSKDFPGILELDINPLIVGRVGTEPVVADARMTLAKPEDRP